MTMNYLDIYDSLKAMFPNAVCELEYTSPYTLLVAVILSAQCTDKRVNLVTPSVFAKYPTVQDMAKAQQEELEVLIRSCGFFRNKSKNIISACKDIVDRFGGQVPNNLNDLMSLNGVGRKTANVMLSTIFDSPAIAVDTHVFRVANRIGLTTAKTPIQSENQLMRIIPKNLWSNSHQMLVYLGRYICKARKPNCDECKLKQYCKGYTNAKDNG